ncbi:MULTISPECIES: hypothetical protein [Microtetraspora]|uniref:Antitoxin n=1 Tax=Microtetraspora glauca TaxID=1996 RepID=A0ABV3GCN3_MICGL|nr:hypothetical protein [Microtetraspora sp. AC03309]MCC5575185.1 hypothetical protein [Microtetraspora sp. AC03309]
MSIIDKVKEMISSTAEKLQNIPKQRHARSQETMGDVTGRGRDTFEGTEGRLGEDTGRRPESPGGTGGPEPR